jgi:hypothetical protein
MMQHNPIIINVLGKNNVVVCSAHMFHEKRFSIENRTNLSSNSSQTRKRVADSKAVMGKAGDPNVLRGARYVVDRWSNSGRKCRGVRGDRCLLPHSFAVLRKGRIRCRIIYVRINLRDRYQQGFGFQILAILQISVHQCQSVVSFCFLIFQRCLLDRTKTLRLGQHSGDDRLPRPRMGRPAAR